MGNVSIIHTECGTKMTIIDVRKHDFLGLFEIVFRCSKCKVNIKVKGTV